MGDQGALGARAHPGYSRPPQTHPTCAVAAGPQSPPPRRAPGRPGRPRGPALLTLAVAAVGGQPVAGGGAAALEAPGDVDAAVGADVAPRGQGALVDVCDGKAHPQHRADPPAGLHPPVG